MKNRDSVSIASLLKTARADAGFSVRALAERVRKPDGTTVSPSYITDIEKGRGAPQPAARARVRGAQDRARGRVTYPHDAVTAMRMYMRVLQRKTLRPNALWGDEAVLLKHYGLARPTGPVNDCESIETQLRMLELTEDGKALFISLALQQDQT